MEKFPIEKEKYQIIPRFLKINIGRYLDTLESHRIITKKLLELVKNCIEGKSSIEDLKDTFNYWKKSFEEIKENCATEEDFHAEARRKKLPVWVEKGERLNIIKAEINFVKDGLKLSRQFEKVLIGSEEQVIKDLNIFLPRFFRKSSIESHYEKINVLMQNKEELVELIRYYRKIKQSR